MLFYCCLISGEFDVVQVVFIFESKKWTTFSVVSERNAFEEATENVYGKLTLYGKVFEIVVILTVV